ncbi:MAG: HEAT repeat domain-containing protein, partial [Elusimicrobia bacterium]|nr:HEAT repeat domain-containing protein [Elusimicrobiota bacterium]
METSRPTERQTMKNAAAKTLAVLLSAFVVWLAPGLGLGRALAQIESEGGADAPVQFELPLAPVSPADIGGALNPGAALNTQSLPLLPQDMETGPAAEALPAAAMEAPAARESARGAASVKEPLAAVGAGAFAEGNGPAASRIAASQAAASAATRAEMLPASPTEAENVLEGGVLTASPAHAAPIAAELARAKGLLSVLTSWMAPKTDSASLPPPLPSGGGSGLKAAGASGQSSLAPADDSEVIPAQQAAEMKKLLKTDPAAAFSAAVEILRAGKKANVGARPAAMRILDGFPVRESAPVWLEVLRGDSSWYMRRMAAQRLGLSAERLRQEDPAELLRAAYVLKLAQSQDENVSVRLAAQWALAQFGAESAAAAPADRQAEAPAAAKPPIPFSAWLRAALRKSVPVAIVVVGGAVVGAAHFLSARIGHPGMELAIAMGGAAISVLG